MKDNQFPGFSLPVDVILTFFYWLVLITTEMIISFQSNFSSFVCDMHSNI
jgi:hypothetical protein